MNKKVMVGMSGGVDSSVTALLLKQQGYDVMGVTLKLFSNDDIVLSDEAKRTCCSLTDVDDARRVAYKIGIDHLVFNFKDYFKSAVMDNFVDSYINGGTPNPCIECNKHIKFKEMLRRAETLGYDYIATGHYAHIIKDDTIGRYLLKRPADRHKDQTYVLYNLTQYQLARTLFPLSGYDKDTVRKIAEENNLINARKPDSQDICFVPGGDYVEFINKYSEYQGECGNFVDNQGNILGTHQGIINYTIGQRKGLGITFGKPMFVVDKDASTNTVVLGDSNELFTKELIAGDVNLISIEKLTEPLKVMAKTRYNQVEQPATVYPLDDDKIKVVFDEPQRAITKGQAVVMYQGEFVLGGGTIL